MTIVVSIITETNVISSNGSLLELFYDPFSNAYVIECRSLRWKSLTKCMDYGKKELWPAFSSFLDRRRETKNNPGARATVWSKRPPVKWNRLHTQRHYLHYISLGISFRFVPTLKEWLTFPTQCIREGQSQTWHSARRNTLVFSVQPLATIAAASSHRVWFAIRHFVIKMNPILKPVLLSRFVF